MVEYRRRTATQKSVRAQNLWTKYRMTVEEFDARREAQGYRCAVCLRHEDELPQIKTGRPRSDGTPSLPASKLLVDHDHRCCSEAAKSCGKCHRDLVCYGCNLALGIFEDKPDALERAAEYLRRWAP